MDEEYFTLIIVASSFVNLMISKHQVQVFLRYSEAPFTGFAESVFSGSSQSQGSLPSSASTRMGRPGSSKHQSSSCTPCNSPRPTGAGLVGLLREFGTLADPTTGRLWPRRSARSCQPPRTRRSGSFGMRPQTGRGSSRS